MPEMRTETHVGHRVTFRLTLSDFNHSYCVDKVKSPQNFVTSFKRFRVLIFGQIRQGKAKYASFETFHWECAKHHYKDKQITELRRWRQCWSFPANKIFVNFVYWNINPRTQPTKVSDLVYLQCAFRFKRKMWKISYSHCDRDCTTYWTTSTNKPQI